MSKQNADKTIPETQKAMCGIVMPISEIDGCSEGHWKEVYSIICQSVDKSGFHPNLVSNSDDVGVIQKRIVQNLYDNPIVVCDMSGRNPNVMFELGIRLAFDKPTIIIKDDKTKYAFDTSPIEHIEYPRDLRFNKIVEFKDRLTEKIIQTHKKASTDENYSTFLKHFGSFKVAKIETEEVSKEDFILDEMKSLRELVMRMNRNISRKDGNSDKDGFLFRKEKEDDVLTMCFGDAKPISIEPLLKQINSLSGIESAEIEELSDEHTHIQVKTNGQVPKRIVRLKLEKIGGDKVAYIE